MTSNNPIRKTMTLIDENKECLPEGVYLEICESLKKLYLMGNDVALRKDFIVSNAINVKNLDI